MTPRLWTDERIVKWIDERMEHSQMTGSLAPTWAIVYEAMRMIRDDYELYMETYRRSNFEMNKTLSEVEAAVRNLKDAFEQG